MDIIDQTLSENPDDIITFEDEPTVLAAVKKLGDEKRIFESSSTKTVGFARRGTHWLLAVVLTPPHGAKPTYRLICLPKSKYDEKDVTHHLDEYTKEVLPFDGE